MLGFRDGIAVSDNPVFLLRFRPDETWFHQFLLVYLPAADCYLCGCGTQWGISLIWGAEGAAVTTMKINALYAGNISDDDDRLYVLKYKTVYSYISYIFGTKGSRNAQAGLSKARDLTADQPRWWGSTEICTTHCVKRMKSQVAARVPGLTRSRGSLIINST